MKKWMGDMHRVTVLMGPGPSNVHYGSIKRSAGDQLSRSPNSGLHGRISEMLKAFWAAVALAISATGARGWRLLSISSGGDTVVVA
jgi:aspartate aminotransferase-like enzyme